MKKSFLTGIAALGAAVVVAGSAGAASLKQTFEGKTVTIVFGFAMGGTYGQYSQFIAHHFPRFIPGKPSIIVQSMPGAGGLKATNHAANVLPKDGTGMFMPPDSIIISELLNRDAARYRSNEFSWLGNVAESNSVVVVTKRSGITSFEDAKRREVIVGSTGRGSQTFLIPQMLNGVFGTKFKIVMGYKGAAGSTHAMELDETHGVSLTWTTLSRNRAQWFDDSPHETKAIPIVQVGFRKEADLMDVPLASDLAKTDEDRQVVNFLASLGPIGRGIAMPPGVRKELVDQLRAAFSEMIADEAFLSDARKRNLTVDTKSGADVQAIVDEVLRMSPEVVERARAIIFDS